MTPINGFEVQRYNFRRIFDIIVAKNWKISINTAGQFVKRRLARSDPMTCRRVQKHMQYIYEATPHLSGYDRRPPGNGFAGTRSEQNPWTVKTGSQLGSQNLS